MHQVVGLGLAEMVKICTDTTSSSCLTSWWVGPGQVTAAEAVKPAVTKLSPGLSVTLWDKLEIQGDSSTTLQDFLDMMMKKYELEVWFRYYCNQNVMILQVTMVVQDSRMVYVPIMPGHKNRLPKMMTSLVKNPDKQGVVLLSVTAAAEGVGKVSDFVVVLFFLLG